MSDTAPVLPPAGPVPPKPPGTPAPAPQAGSPPPPAAGSPPAPASPPRLPKHLRRAQREMRRAMFRRLRRSYIQVLLVFLAILLVPAFVFRNHIYWTLAISGREPNAFRRAAWDYRILSDAGVLLDHIRDNLDDPGYAEKAIRDADVPFWLKGHAPEVKRAFVRGLGDLRGNPDAQAALRRLLEDPSVALRPEIADALARHGDPADAPRLESILAGDGPPALRAAAALALGTLRSVPSIPRLLEAVKGAPEPVAGAAVKALASFSGSAEAARLIAESFRSPFRTVRIEALSAASLMALEGGLSEEALDAFRKESRARLEDADPGIRLAALSLLGDLRDESSLPSIIRIYMSRDPAFVGTATQAIVRMGAHAIPEIRKALAAAPQELRREMVWLLGQIVDPRSIDLLLDLLRDSDPYVRQRANVLLERMTGQKDIHFDYAGPPDEQAKDAARWREWWGSNAGSIRLRALQRDDNIPPPIPRSRHSKP